MGNQMDLNFEDFGNDSNCMENRDNLNTIYPLTENLHNFDICTENVTQNDESFSLAYSYIFNHNVNENELVDMEQLEFLGAQNEGCEMQVEKNSSGIQKYEEEYKIKNKIISEFENTKEDNGLTFEIKKQLNTSDNAIEKIIEKSADKIMKCSLFNTVEKIPDIYSENQIIIKIRTSSINIKLLFLEN